MNNNASMRMYEQFPSQRIYGVTSKFSDLEGDDNNYELPTSSIYSTQELAKLKIPNQFNIFHTNINGLENKFEILHEFITNASYDRGGTGYMKNKNKLILKFVTTFSVEWDLFKMFDANLALICPNSTIFPALF